MDNSHKFLLTLILFMFIQTDIKSVSSSSSGLSDSSNLSDRRLAAWYQGYNEKYFNQELPKDVLITKHLIDDRFMAQTFYQQTYYHIALNPRYNVSPVTERGTLLHEMCHVRGLSSGITEFPDHGPLWQSCMHRLANLGALEDVW